MTIRTLLIGLDGATFRVLDPLMRDGVMPYLKGFVDSGVRAELGTIIPALTPPAWTSLVTGCAPGQHGIFDFFRKESPEGHGMRFATSHDVGCPTIWSVANQHGLRAIALNFPLTFPPPPIDGYVVPGWMPWRQLRLGCHPAGLYDRLKALPGFNPRELAMDMLLEEKALEGCEQDEYDEWIALHIRREQGWFQILKTLVEEEDPCELVTVLFDGVDKLQHLCWRFIDPALGRALELPWERRVSDLCLGYFRQMDALLASLVRLAGQDATVLVASDHGFGPQVRTFFVNTWLEEQGYLAWSGRDVPRASDRQVLGVGHIARHEYLLDWERTRAYAPLPSGNGIHIVRADDDHPYGVPESEYEALRERIRAGLLAIQDPVDGTAVVSQVWKREELFAGPYLALAPDLTLVLQDSGLVSILASDVVVQPRPQPTGTHRPEGIFVGRGPGFRQGERLSPLSILDVAPLVIHSLGLPIPPHWRERLPLTALERGYLRTHPIKTAASWRPTQAESATFGTEPELDEAAQRELLGRLRALGYVE